MSKKRVVITGVGTVNPIGNSVDEYWGNLLEGKHGISKVESFDTTGYTTTIAGQIKNFTPETYFDKKEIRRTSKFIIYGVAAAVQALEDSGYDVASDPTSIGVEVGSGIGGIEILENMTLALHQKGPGKVSPFTVPMMIPDMASGLIAIKTGAQGPNSCSVTACASSAHSIANAFNLIQDGRVTAMLSGGAESTISPLGLASFCAARSLSQRNDDPARASRPFDGDRDGFVMGEGAGIVVLEELEHAKKRGATIYAEVIGSGSTGDAYHITAPAPEGEGANRAMRMAMDDAGINPEDVDYINAHGTSTVLNDKNETQAIKAVFGDHAYKMNISSTKSMTGHLLGATGAIEIIACIKAINNNVVPPTINQETPDEFCDLNYTPNTTQERDVKIAMSNSFGFGGHNGVLIVKEYK